jgi:hypothetical protein
VPAPRVVQEGGAVGRGHVGAMQEARAVFAAGVHAHWHGQSITTGHAAPGEVGVGAACVGHAAIARGSASGDVLAVDGKGRERAIGKLSAGHAARAVGHGLEPRPAGQAVARALGWLVGVGGTLQAPAAGRIIVEARGAWGARAGLRGAQDPAVGALLTDGGVGRGVLLRWAAGAASVAVEAARGPAGGEGAKPTGDVLLTQASDIATFQGLPLSLR